jgi:hypothetical protein
MSNQILLLHRLSTLGQHRKSSSCFEHKQTEGMGKTTFAGFFLRLAKRHNFARENMHFVDVIVYFY